MTLDGLIQFTGADGKKVTLGQVQLTRFRNPAALKRMPGSSSCIYESTPEAIELHPSQPGASGAGQILSGFLERSNVDVIEESLRMKFLMEWRASLLRAMDHSGPAR